MSENAIEVTRLLVVSRDSSVLNPLWSVGESNGWEVDVVSDPWEAIEKAQSEAPLDLLLLDLPRENADGMHSLRRLRRMRPAMPIILIGQPGDNGRKQESIRMGASDYLISPIEDRQLATAIQRNLTRADEAAEPDITSDDIEPVSEESFFIGVSTIMRKLRAQAALLAETNAPVLILGEDGSGKATTARLVHNLSVRSGFEFAKVNCAALPGDLLERELFGCEKKDTSAPARTKTGKLEFCANGTIFLEEITEMPPGLQSNLLEVLKNKRFIRPGTSDFVETNVRVVAASSINVELAISENRLREDLYRQLSAYTIHLPSLRERKEELSLLSRLFMHRLGKHYGLPPREFSPAILEAWRAYNWPGNLRELERCVKRYLMVGDEELTSGKIPTGPESELHETDLAGSRGMSQTVPSPSQSREGASGSKSLRSLVQSVKAEAEKDAITGALEKTGWNRKAAARMLKVSYRSVLYKIEQYQIIVPDSSAIPRTNGHRTEETGFRGDDRAKGPVREICLSTLAKSGQYGR
ncbi:MAG: sigma-54 dependent transcriptional regulator [Terracidiphilus sp.]|jgi:DNA-binding NtrC family response regulator